jgi:hypothetical protein
MNIHTKFQIDNDIPLPTESRNRNGNAKYPFALMEVGQSVFIPGKTVTQMANATCYLKAKGKKFASRRVVEDGADGVRVWRVE